MVIAPQTNIRLLKTPIELDNRNQLTFASKQSQYNYFNGLPKVTLDNATYQRKDNVLRFPTNQNLTFEDLLQFNYCMYQNDSYDDKWFYAFITNISYENNGMSLITLETDVFQTWQFDISYRPSFIEREHVNDDTVGLHTLPEGLETGPYISNGFVRDNNLSDFVYVVQSTEFAQLPSAPEGKPKATNLGGVSVPGAVYVCETVIELVAILDLISPDTAVFNVYTVPKIFIPVEQGSMLFTGMSNPVTYNINIPKQNNLGGYYPKNNKLLTSPYNYLVLDNNNGTSNILNYEYFSTNDCEFEVAGVPTVGGSIKCVPLNYKGVERYQQEGIMAGKFPTCGWINDTYTNWLTQQAVNLQVGMTATKMRLIGSTLGDIERGVGAIVNRDISQLSFSRATNEMASNYEAVGKIEGMMYEHEMTPNTASGNTNGGDIATCYNMNKFYFIKMSIRPEYARCIDDFFSMFGYKINRVKSPNITGRANWNYVKTSGCNFTGNIPQNDMQIIKSLFNAGITLWHNSSTFLDYSQSNNIV